MQKLKTFFIITTFLLAIPISSIAQEPSTNQSFWVHEDVVKPSMIGAYEKVCKELVAQLKDNNIQDENWIAASTADSRYFFVGAIDNMAALDRQLFSSLSDKIGDENVGKIFEKMDKCYEVEHDYVLNLDPDLSYMPNGMTQTPENQNYRKWHYLYMAPENRGLVKEKMQEIKEFFASKNSKMHYRVYKSGFGTKGEFYMVSVAAADAVDYANKTAANDALFGEEGQAMFQDLYSHLLKFEEVVGQMRPDLAYSPSN